MPAKPEIPFGKAETDRLELKGAKALENLRSLARAVVALLNSKGGQLWIGLAEHEGVASTVEPIAGLRCQTVRLQDGLIDLVEPSPIVGEEIDIVPIPRPEGADEGLLRVDVKRGRRGPYAFLDGMLRGYVVRSGSRVRPMTREELRSGFSGKRREDFRQELSAALSQEFEKSAASGFRGLELLIQPALPDGVELPLDPKALLKLFREATETGNRELGWTFADSSGELRPAKGGGLAFQRDRLVVQRRGLVRYREPLERLVWKGNPREIWPYALAELPTSVLRLARRLYSGVNERVDPEVPVAAALSLFGIRGWTLRPHSPRAVGYQFREAPPFDEDAVVPAPLIFSWKDVQSSPDRCGFRLLVRLYEGFGYFEDAVPAEFSRETGTLTIPS